MYGGQNVNVTLTSTDVQYNTGSEIFSANVTVKNLILQPIGTTDGSTLAPDGVRVFFHSGPTTTSGTGVVTVANQDGTAAFTAPGQPYFQYNEVLENNETSAPKNWQWNVPSTVSTFAFSVYIDAEVEHGGNYVDVQPASVTLAPSGATQTFTGTLRRFTGATLSGPAVTWSSSNPAVASIDENSGVLTTHTEGSVTVTGTSGTASGTADVTVVAPVVGAADSYTATSNIAITHAAVTGPLANDGAPGATVSEVNGSASNVGSWTNTTATGLGGNTGRVKLNADGSFDYDPPPGYTGADQFSYRATRNGSTSAPLTVTVTTSSVSGEIMWFVCDACGGSSNKGTLLDPFTSVSNFRSINGTGGLAPAAGHSVYIRSGTYDALGDNLTMLASQKAYGQGIAASSVYTPDAASHASFSALTAGSPPALTFAGAPMVLLSTNNTLRGFTITTVTGADGIFGSSFGTLTSSSMTVNGGGRALSLTNGTLAGGFEHLSSTGGTNNVALTNVNSSGDLPFGQSGDVFSGASGPAISISGGSISFTRDGSVTQANNAPLLSVSGGHSGTLTFTGMVSATNGTGLQFDNADGGYAFSGTTSLNNTLAPGAINIVNGSTGTFTFGTASFIGNTNTPKGTAFRVNGSTPSVTYSGNMTQATAGQLLVDITNQASGTITFQTGTLQASNGNGINLSNADGTINFNGTTTMVGGDAGVDVVVGSSGTIGFSSLSIASPVGTALNVNASAPNLTVNGSITNNLSRVVDIGNAAAAPCGTINVGASLSASGGSGLRVTQCNAGTITFSSPTQSISTGVNEAVNLLSNTGATIRFTGGALTLGTSTGDAFSATAGGTVTVEGSSNTINSTGGRALNLSLIQIGANGMQFSSVASGGGTNNITAAGLGGTGDLTITGSGTLGGTANGSTAVALSSNTRSISISSGISKSTSGLAVSVSGQSAGTVNLSGTLSCITNCSGISVTGGTGGSVINFSGSTKTINATAPSITVSSNGSSGGSTINFTNGNLQFTSTSGGVNVTSGGTINVTGSGNVLSTTGTGVPLTVTNTNIGVSNMTFQSISSTGGAVNGILLSSTGGGRLIVTGNGGVCTIVTPTCTGGLIQATSGEGISLTSTNDPSFTAMRLINTQGSGIRGTGVTGLTLNNILINGAGDVDNEAGMFFAATAANNLSGTATFSAVTVTAPSDNGVVIQNSSGSLTLNISGSTFQNTQFGQAGVVTGDDLLKLVADGTSSITTTISGSSFSTSENNGIGAYAQGGSAAGSGGTMRLTVGTSTFSGGTAVGNTSGSGIEVGGSLGGTARFNINNNSQITNWTLNGISITGNGNADVQGQIVSNTIGTSTSRSGSYTLEGIRVFATSNALVRATIQSNTVNKTFRQGIVALIDAAAANRLDAHITSNTLPFSPDDTFGATNVQVERRAGTACARVSSNTVQPGSAGLLAIRLLATTGTTVFSQHGMFGSNDVSATSFLQSQNPGTAAASMQAASNTGWNGFSCVNPTLP